MTSTISWVPYREVPTSSPVKLFKLTTFLDFDPEADDKQDTSSNSDGSGDDDVELDGAREHYVEVGKSKLRKPRSAPLGQQYRGSRIRRNAMSESEDEDDPFGKRFEEEGGESEDVGVYGVRGSSAENDDSNEDVEDLGDLGTHTDSGDDDDDEEAQEPQTNGRASSDERRQLLRTVAKDQKAVASSLAQSTKADAEKGRAVKKQRTTFDSLLNARIKLQKTLVGANTIVGTPQAELEDQRLQANQAIKAAETAAFNLWSSLNEFREGLTIARSGEKRKRGSLGSSTPTEQLWSHMQSQEEANLPHRNAILQRWSRKARSATAVPERGLVSKSEQQATIIDSLQEHLSNRERLLKRAHTPRSCAPLQVANRIIEDDTIYDDADFYGLLLKELLERNSQDSAAASNIDLNFNLQREAKMRKDVDTKASKGRKLRYTVHEKLQNFMAPEDRSTWGERQTDELFGSLFGQTLGLGEEREENARSDDDVNADEAGLMMFRG